MPRILVADDNSNIQRMAALALKEADVEVVAVGNGEAAVRKLPELMPDLVLADVFMPVRNGYEVCEFVKRDARFAHIPVILLVGAFDPLDEREAQRVHADGVLKKPFVPPDPLVNMVKTLLAKSAGERLAAMPKPEPVPVAVAAHGETETSAFAPAAPAPPAVLGEEFPEETYDAPQEFSLPNAKLEERDQPVAFGSLLDSPAMEADAETTVTASRDPNLGEPSFWTPAPASEPSVEEEQTDHAWGAENDVLPRREEAALLRPVEPAQTEVPGWMPQVPAPDHFSMEQVSADPEKEASEVIEGSSRGVLATAPSVPQEPAHTLPSFQEIPLPGVAEEMAAPTAAEDHDTGATSAPLDLEEPEFRADLAGEVSSPFDLAAESMPPSEPAPLASLPLAEVEQAADKSEADGVGTRVPLLEVLGIESDEEFVVAERVPRNSSMTQSVEVGSESRGVPEVVTAVLERDSTAEESTHSSWASVHGPESAPQMPKLTAVPDALQGTPAAPELTLTPVSPAELAVSPQYPLDPAAIAAIVDRVIEHMQPKIMDVVTREILRPVVEALVERELKQR